jgi:hypothetical protein
MMDTWLLLSSIKSSNVSQTLCARDIVATFIVFDLILRSPFPRIEHKVGHVESDPSVLFMMSVRLEITCV